MPPTAYLSATHRLTAVGRRVHAWSHRGPVRSAVTKVLVSVAGVAVLLAGVAMLVLPGPGLVVMAVGLGLLATEWPWAQRLVRTVGTRLAAAKAATTSGHASRRRRVLAVGGVAAVMVLGFATTTAVTAFLGTLALG